MCGGQEEEGLTFVGLRLQDLTAGLVLKLVVLTQEVVTETAAEYPASCRPEDVRARE